MNAPAGLPRAGQPTLPAGLPESWRGETYHGRPVVKPSGFDIKVATYIALLGLAGSLQVIASVSREAGVKRQARLLALAGSLVGPLVLVRHLKTPRRWYNMLRIVRPTSPMSLGSWLLTGFGALSFVVAAGDLLGRRWPLARRFADAAQVPTAVAGAGMSVYTASLLASTSTPLWRAAPAGMAAQFGTASMAGAASALALGQRAVGDERAAARLERFATVAAGAELVATILTERHQRLRGVRPQDSGHGALGILLPVAAHLAGQAVGGRLGRALPTVASLALIAGGAIMRQRLLQDGDASTRRPEPTFRTTQLPRR